MMSSDGPLTGILMRFTYKVETYLANSIWREFFKKMQTLDSGFSPDFAWGTVLWSLVRRLFELKINISHIVINDW